MRTVAVIGAAALVIGSGCGATSSPATRTRLVEPPRYKEPYRPAWTAGIALHIDEIRLCLAEREPPFAVVHVQDLATGATGVTAVDGFGHAENCAVEDGRVVSRERADVEVADLAGLPVFAPGAKQPKVGVGGLLEEVVEGDLVLGWLYWPSTGGLGE